jgi:hypothetical protein
MVSRGTPRYLVFSHLPCRLPEAEADALMNATVVPLDEVCRPRSLRSNKTLRHLVGRAQSLENMPVVSTGMLSAELKTAEGYEAVSAADCQQALADLLSCVRKGEIEGISFDLGQPALQLISHCPRKPLRLHDPRTGRWVNYGPDDQAAVLRSIWGHIRRSTFPQPPRTTTSRQAGCPAPTQESAASSRSTPSEVAQNRHRDTQTTHRLAATDGV